MRNIFKNIKLDEKAGLFLLQGTLALGSLAIGHFSGKIGGRLSDIHTNELMDKKLEAFAKSKGI